MNSLDTKYKPSWLSSASALHGLMSVFEPEIEQSYVAGISGIAFRNVVEDLVIPGSFNTNFVWTDVFSYALDRLGVVSEVIQATSNQLLFTDLQDLLWEKIVAANERKMPVLIWERFEFGLVTGCDSQAKTYVCNGVSGKTEYRKTELGKGDVPILFGAVPVKKVDINKKDAVIMSLRVAIANGFISRPPYPTGYNPVLGVDAYSKWADELKKDFNAFGNSYLIQILLDARRSASLFLANISSVFEDEVVTNLLARASERFAQTHAKLLKMADIFPFPGEKLFDDEGIKMAKELLSDCSIMETEGFKLISTALERLDKKND